MLDELEQSVARLKAVAGRLTSLAYEGYSTSNPGFVSPPTSKHGMVEGCIEVKNERMHKELENLKHEADRVAREIDGIAGKYYRMVWDRSPAETVTDEQLKNLEEYEARRQGLTRK